MSNEEIVWQIQNGVSVQKNQEKLYLNNRKFILRLIKISCGFTEGLEDLEQQGFLGLMNAAVKYQPAKGSSFISYAAYWIKQSIYRYNENCAGSVRVPAYMKSNIRRYERFKNSYKSTHGRFPTAEEFCQELKLSGYSLKRLEETIYSIRAVRLDSPVPGGNTDQSYLSFLRSDEELEESVTYSVYRRELHEELEKALNILEPVTRKMIYSVYYQGYSRRRTAELFGCTRQNVDERIGKGFYHILHSPHRGILESFMDPGYQYKEWAYSEYGDLDIDSGNEFLV